MRRLAVISLMNLDRLSINPSAYDLMSTVSHELDEALGLGSGVGRANVRPEDLFRFSSTGARNYTSAGDDARS